MLTKEKYRENTRRMSGIPNVRTGGRNVLLQKTLVEHVGSVVCTGE